MPISSAAFVRRTIVLMLAGLAVLAVIITASLWLVERTQDATDQMLATRSFRSATADLLNLVQGAETSQRGYLLTGEDSYLAPYAAARAALPEAIADMRRPLRTESGRRQVDALVRSIDAKFAELNETLDLARAGRREEALAIVRSDRGKILMDEARSRFAALIALAEERLAERVATQKDSADALQWVNLLGAVLIVLVVGGSAWTVTRYTRDILLARREVEALNVGLEHRVSERTADLAARTADLATANEEIQRYAYIVSHDLRAPLVNIMGYTSEIETSLGPLSEVLERAPSDDPAVPAAREAISADLPESIRFIRSSTDRMDRLISAILKMSREGRRVLRVEAIPLRPLLDAVGAAMSHRLAELDGTLVIEGDGIVRSDRLALEQIFANLVDNAVKYRQPGRAPAIAARIRKAGERVVVEIEDNGRGIAKADRERVFELFRRAGAQDQPGEGIGLAHVLALVRRLGGEIDLRSEPGQGSTFQVTLPLRAPHGSTEPVSG